jgi:hypothetical protein
MNRLMDGDRGSGIGDRGSGEPRVDALLDALAAEDARVAAPSHLESEVMRAWDAHQTLRPRSWARPWFPLAWRLAAVAVALLAIYYSLPGRRPATEVASPVATNAAPLSSLTAEAGVPLVADPLADPTALNVMRVRMSRSALANLGLPILDPDAAGVVDVEVLVGEDGVARSIRRAAFAGTHVIEE